MKLKSLTDALGTHLPEVLRWGGAVARQLRQHNISLAGKSSGSAYTDALTLADLTVQELLVSALRDRDPNFRKCCIDAEEETGDLDRFATDGEYTIALDPIDGTKQYRDKTGNAYAVMLHLRSVVTVHYSLVYLPEDGEHGSWVEAVDDQVVCGPDDPSRPARKVLDTLKPVDPTTWPGSKKIYLIGFQNDDPIKARMVSDSGLEGVPPDRMPGNILPLMSRGEYGGSLIHTPNVYDFPVLLHIARIFGGDAHWVHNDKPVHFQELWIDDRADMLRLPGIVACGSNHQTLDRLVDLARGWNPIRYAK